MPRSKVLPAVVLLPLLSTACATAPIDGDVYRESATDVVNRAPSSMSPPQQVLSANGGTVIDKVHLRSQADYHFTIAESYSLEGNSARAIEEYKLTLIYDNTSPTVRLRLAGEYVKQGLVSEAIEHAKSAVQIDPKYVEARLLLGGLYSALRMYDDAIAEYRMVLKENPESSDAPMFIGAILAEQKKYKEAATHFEKLARAPGSQNAYLAWYYLGRIRLEEDREKNLAKAEAAFRESLVAKPSHAEALIALGQLLESTGRKSQVAPLYLAFQEKHGPSEVVAEELSRLFIDAKDYKRAYEQLAILEASDSSDVNVKSKMAFILIEQQKHQEAIVRLEEVLAIEPDSDKIRFYLGAVYEEVKDYRSAITHFQQIPAISSYYKESVVHVAYLYKLLGDYDKAVTSIEAGIAAKDDHPPFYALYASLLDDTKQYGKGVEMLTAAVKKFPEHAQLRFFLGNMQDRTGDKKATIESMRKVLELDKDHVQALNFLAYTYADSGKSLDEAERMVRRALELQPNDGYILDTLGWVLFKRGNASEAIRVLEEAMKAQPTESVIAEHLGDAYYQQQMPEKAKRYYMRAAEIETNVAQAEKIRAKIVAIERQFQSIQQKPVSVDDSGRMPASEKAH